MSYDTAIIVDRSRKTKKKINNLENRITQQESTSKSLLNKSYELEAELLNKRNSDVMSSRLQQQWEDHLRDVTDEVRSLNKDVAQLRNEVNWPLGVSNEILTLNSVDDQRSDGSRKF